MTSELPLRAIVVEDERLPRLTLLQKLEDLRQQVEVVDSCDNYDDALQSILRLKPDLLLLDIQLQGRDAIELLNEVSQSMPLPYVIFTTAYSDRNYLMSAIKLAAVDYLLKPIDKNNLAVAIAKAVERYEATHPRLDADTGRHVLRTATGKLLLQDDDIAYVRADGNYSQVSTFDAVEDTLVSLAAMEQTLDKATFWRIDRSTIVNRRLVYKLNAKRRLCTLRSPDGRTVTLELSKAGLDAMLRLL